MSVKLYVGNLSFATTENDLQDLFAQVGTVLEVKLIQDRDTGSSRGFGFVTMNSQEEANSAISRFNGFSLGNRALTVNEARPQESHRIVPLDVRTQVVVAIFADAELRIQDRCREADYDFFATLIGQPCWTHLQTVT